MSFAFFHNLLFNDPVANLVLLIVALIGWIVSTTLVVYGVYSLIQYRGYLDPIARKILVLIPVLTVGAVAITRSAWLTFPFGFFAGLPIMFMVDTQSLLNFYLLVWAGTLANICGGLGLFRWVSKKFGYR